MKWMSRCIAVAMIFLLGACSGSGGSASSTRITGVAATGAAISGTVTVKDASGAERATTSDASGAYSLSVDGMTPPFLIRVEFTRNNLPQRLYSYAAGGGTANVTPLTSALLTAASGATSLDSLYQSATVQTLDAIRLNLPASTDSLLATLKPFLAASGASGVDPFSGTLKPGGGGMDAFLDAYAITSLQGTITLTDSHTGTTVAAVPASNPSSATLRPLWSDTDTAIASDPSVATAADGTVMAVWSEQSGTTYVIRGRLLDGQSSSTTISTAGNSGGPKLAWRAPGEFVCVWIQYNGSGFSDIMAARYSGSAWSTPVVISQNTGGHPGWPEIAADTQGRVVAAWHQGNGQPNHFDIYVTSLGASGFTWSQAQKISNGTNSSFLPKIGTGSTGKGVVAWQQDQSDGSVSNGPQDIVARTIDFSSLTLGASTKINNIDGAAQTIGGVLAMAVDPSGNALAAWQQNRPGGGSDIQVARMNATGGWSTSIGLTANPSAGCVRPAVAYAADGSAIVVWLQQDGNGTSTLASARWNGSTWLAPTAGPATPGIAWDPIVSLGPTGDGVVAWYAVDSRGISIQQSRIVNGTFAATSEMALTGMSFGMEYPAFAMTTASSGVTTMIWGTDSM